MSYLDEIALAKQMKALWKRTNKIEKKCFGATDDLHMLILGGSFYQMDNSDPEGYQECFLCLAEDSNESIHHFLEECEVMQKVKEILPANISKFTDIVELSDPDEIINANRILRFIKINKYERWGLGERSASYLTSLQMNANLSSL